MYFAVLSLTVLSMLRQVTSTAPASCSDEPIMAGWYVPDGSPPSIQKVSWDKYTSLCYSFATTTPDVHTLSLDGDPSLLPQFVKEAHDHGVSACVSMGGWGGSIYFSSHVATPENRTAFVQTVADFATKYNLDAIEVDWEYPNHQGIGCNTINVNDTENLLLFLQELRAHPVGSQLTLSAATPLTPFRDTSGNPSVNVSGFATVLDHITIMNYDVWGSWSSAVGANAPLNDTCAPPADQVGSAVSALLAWTNAGMPAGKIALGVAGYGHSFSVAPHDAFVNGSNTDLAPYPKFNASNQPAGDAQSISGGTDVCGNKEGPGGTYTFPGLIDNGFLDKDGNPAPSIYHRFDNCSQTPYVYNETSNVMVSYDDVRSFAAKGKFIKEMGLKGCSFWHTSDDRNDLLLDSIRIAADIKTAKTRKRDWNWNA